MTRLLSAGFVRLKKDKSFWTGMGFMALFGIFLAVNVWSDYHQYGLEPSFKRNLFSWAQFCGILTAAFSSLFLGTEYSDGTLRNKLIAGHRRTSVYLSSLVLSLTASLLMTLTFQLVLILAGTILLGAKCVFLEAGSLLCCLAVGFLLILAYCAIFTFISMLIQKRAVAAVVSILVSFILLFMGAHVLSALSQPEYWESYTLTMDSKETAETVQEPNPHYLRGTKREVYEFLFDFLPGAQSLRLFQTGIYVWQPPFYSLLIAICFTGGGILLFRKKNLN